MATTETVKQRTTIPSPNAGSDASNPSSAAEANRAAEDNAAPYTIAETSHPLKRSEVIAEGFRNRTKGEALFNKISYIGFGYFLVTAVSIFMTWLLRDTRRIAPKFAESAKKVTEKFGLHHDIIDIGTLFLGGSIASVLPVKWLEDRKSELVKKFDRFYYTDDQIKNTPSIQAAYKELDTLPKQTWLSVAGSRIVAFAATFSLYALAGSNKGPLAKLTGESISKRAIQFGRWMDKLWHRSNPAVVAEIEASAAENIRRMSSTYGDKALKGLELMREGPHADRVASRIWSYTGLDGLYTLVTSGTLFVGTRVLGGLWGKQAPGPSDHPSSLDQLKSQAALAQQSAGGKKPAAVEEVPEPVAPRAKAAPEQAAKREIPTHHVAQPHYAERLHTHASEPHVTA